MPFETHDTAHSRPTVAIVGAGISGLGAAWRLAATCDVTVFEADARLGGHSRTIMAGPDRSIPVDTGFMVFNDRTYPNMIALFNELDIPAINAPMSFAVSMDEGEFEYALTNLSRVFADRRNLFNPRFFKLLLDITTFNRKAAAAAHSPDMTLGELLKFLGLDADFSNHYLYPLAGAIWSAARHDMHSFPAQTFVRFFENHGLLSAHGGPQWKTVSGGSRIYVERLAARLQSAGVAIHCNAQVEAAGRHPAPWLKIADQAAQSFDHVILACHSDQSLRILQDASPDVCEVLGAIGYRPNQAYLHADTSHMPTRKAAWSSWVYKGQSEGEETSGSFTYWMNALQSIPDDTPLFVTLNPEQEIPEHLIYDQSSFSHPVFDLAAIKAQARLPSLQGRDNMWFCGAWTRYGFHEDGLQSGLSVADAISNALSRTRALTA